MEKSLRDLRLEAGLRQTELAKKIGCNYRLYNAIENVERDFERVKQDAVKFLEAILKDENLAKRTALRRMRLKAGLTQREVATRIHCVPQHYSCIERGKCKSLGLRASAMALFEEILKGGKKP